MTTNAHRTLEARSIPITVLANPRRITMATYEAALSPMAASVRALWPMAPAPVLDRSRSEQA